MDRMGLTPTQHETYLVEIFGPHERVVTVELFRRSDGKSAGMVDRVLEGRVTMERKRTPSRILEATLLDESGALAIEPSSSGLPLHQMYEVVVTDKRNLPSLGWVDCTVFTGPVQSCVPTGASVVISAHGRDTIADGDAWHPKTWPKKTRKSSIISKLLEDSGFTRKRIPILPYTTPGRTTLKGKPGKDKKDKRVNIDIGASRWALARKLAKSIPGYHLYVTALGVPVLGKYPKAACMTLTEQHLLSDPRVEPKAEFFNSWLLLGKKPPGQKKRIRAKAELPAWHPLSPKSLKFNGEPWRNVDTIEDDKVKTKKAAERILADRRRDALTALVPVSVEVPPIPCVDEGDYFKLAVGPASKIRVDTFTLPIGEGGEAMTLGAIVRFGGGPRQRWAA